MKRLVAAALIALLLAPSLAHGQKVISDYSPAGSINRTDKMLLQQGARTTPYTYGTPAQLFGVLASPDITGALGYTPPGLALTNTFTGANQFSGSGVAISVTGTGAILLPIGTTGQQPDTGNAGEVRYNSTTGRFEFGVGGSWVNYVRLSGDTLTGSTFTGGTFSGPTLSGTIAGSPTWSGNHVFSGLAQFSPSRSLSGAVTPSFLISENFSGSALSGQVFLNQFVINSDTIDATTAAGGGVNNFYFGNVVSAGAIGGRTGVGTNLVIAGAVTTTSGNPFYVSLGSGATAQASAGGTSGAGNARGNLFAGNDGSALAAGAGLYWNSVVGREVDIGLATGTGAVHKQGFKVVQYSTDAVTGTVSDYAYGLANQSGGTAPGWTVGFTFGSPDGWWPVKSTGTLIGTYAGVAGGPSMSAANGVDFSSVTFSTAFLKSSGFLVNGSGQEGIGVTPASALAIKETGGGILNAGQLGGNNSLVGLGVSESAAAQVSASNYILLGDANNTLVNAPTGVITLRVGNAVVATASFSSTAIFNVAGPYQVNGTQVVGPRDTGWTAMTGTPDKATAYATGTITLPQLAGRLMQMQASLTTHGLLGP